MSTDYAPPVPSYSTHGDANRRAILSGDAYVTGPRSTRWHRVRSRIDTHHADGTLNYTSLSAWCGQAMSRDACTVPDLDPADPLCGPCQGAWEGWQRQRSLVFDPRTAKASKCPGSHAWPHAKTVAWLKSRPNLGECLFCGEFVKLTGWGYDNPRVQAHRPGPRLPEPCLLHGYLRFRLTESGPACACGGDA